MLLTIEVVHKFELPPGLCSAVSLEAFKALESKMAKTKDELDQLKAETDAAVARIAEDTAAFNTSIQALKDQVAALESQIGETTPEVQAIIDGLRSTINSIDPDPSNPPAEPPPVEEPTP